jgi:hypothetical protein
MRVGRGRGKTGGEEKKPSATKCSTRLVHSRERETTLTLKTGSVYHVRNITCIHLRAKGPNIYIYRRERIYKEPTEEIQ